MTRRPEFFLAVLCALLFPLSVNAAVLGSIYVGSSGGSLWGNTVPTDPRFIFDIGGSIWDEEYAAIVFDMLVDPSDAGSSFVVSSGTEFDEAVAYLTNGVNDVITWEFERGGTGWTEGGFFHGDYTGANGADLAGSQIDNITLTVDHLFFSEPEPGWRDYDFAGTVTINGTPPIPEPETNAMMMVGLTGLGMMLRKRRKPEKSQT